VHSFKGKNSPEAALSMRKKTIDAAMLGIEMPKSCPSSSVQGANGSNKEGIKTYKIYILWRKLAWEHNGGASRRCPRTQAVRHLRKLSYRDIP
jgi:hypothetical protein